MDNVMSWLPFPADEQANQRCRKWQSCGTGTFHYNMEGQLLDARDFIPRTSRNEAHKAEYAALENLDNLERWFAQRMATGSRNNHMIKYALALVDSGMDFKSVSDRVHSFNKAMNNSLSEDEINSTILITAAKRIQELEGK